MKKMTNAPTPAPNPTAKTVVQPSAEGFHWAVSPKSFVTDAGPSFRSRSYRAAVTDLSSTSTTRPVGA
jgi:transposase InsO family protein